MPGQIYIEYEKAENYAANISNRNDKMLNELHEIQNTIKSLEGKWESDSAEAVRQNIIAMENSFQQYYDVVDDYVKVIRNAVAAFKATERTNTANADAFKR